MNELGTYLEKYRIEKNMSRREFAKKLHTSPDTLVRMIEESEPPTIKFLRAVSGHTGIGLLPLLRMAFPDEIPQPSAKAIAAAEKIDAMPEPRRSWFLELLDNANTRGAKAGFDETEIRIIEK